jgi:L-malate glycosyltransferase
VEVLLACWPAVCQQFPTAHLVILGEGTLRSQLESLATNSACQKQVHFLGRVNEMPSYLQSADLFVLPSLAEGLSNALLEAMACGLPVIAADLPGNKELLSNSINGVLTRAGDSAELAKAVSSLLADKNQQEKLGKQARERASAYNIKLIAEQYKVLYQTL